MTITTTAAGADEPSTPFPDLEHWEARVAQTRVNQLVDIRNTAEKWRSGISTLVTVIAGAALIGKPNISADNLVGGVGLVAWALGVFGLSIALLSAMRASHGLPGKETRLFPETLAAWELEEANRSRLWLLCAWCTAPIGVFGILAGVVLSSLAQ